MPCLLWLQALFLQNVNMPQGCALCKWWERGDSKPCSSLSSSVVQENNVHFPSTYEWPEILCTTHPNGFPLLILVETHTGLGKVLDHRLCKFSSCVWGIFFPSLLLAEEVLPAQLSIILTPASMIKTFPKFSNIFACRRWSLTPETPIKYILMKLK